MKLRSIRPPSVVGDNIGYKEIVGLPQGLDEYLNAKKLAFIKPSLLLLA